MPLNPILTTLAKQAARRPDNPKQPPNYRLAFAQPQRCASCKFFSDKMLHCERYNIGVDANYVCDTYKPIEINFAAPAIIKQSDAYDGARSGEAKEEGSLPTQEENKPPIPPPNPETSRPGADSVYPALFNLEQDPKARLQKVADMFPPSNLGNNSIQPPQPAAPPKPNVQLPQQQPLTSTEPQQAPQPAPGGFKPSVAQAVDPNHPSVWASSIFNSADPGVKTAAMADMVGWRALQGRVTSLVDALMPIAVRTTVAEELAGRDEYSFTRKAAAYTPDRPSSQLLSNTYRSIGPRPKKPKQQLIKSTQNIPGPESDQRGFVEALESSKPGDQQVKAGDYQRVKVGSQHVSVGNQRVKVGSQRGTVGDLQRGSVDSQRVKVGSQRGTVGDLQRGSVDSQRGSVGDLQRVSVDSQRGSVGCLESSHPVTAIDLALTQGPVRFYNSLIVKAGTSDELPTQDNSHDPLNQSHASNCHTDRLYTTPLIDRLVAGTIKAAYTYGRMGSVGGGTGSFMAGSPGQGNFRSPLSPQVPQQQPLPPAQQAAQLDPRYRKFTQWKNQQEAKRQAESDPEWNAYTNRFGGVGVQEERSRLPELEKRPGESYVDLQGRQKTLRETYKNLSPEQQKSLARQPNESQSDWMARREGVFSGQGASGGTQTTQGPSSAPNAPQGQPGASVSDPAPQPPRAWMGTTPRPDWGAGREQADAQRASIVADRPPVNPPVNTAPQPVAPPQGALARTDPWFSTYADPNQRQTAAVPAPYEPLSDARPPAVYSWAARQQSGNRGFSQPHALTEQADRQRDLIRQGIQDHPANAYGVGGYISGRENTAPQPPAQGVGGGGGGGAAPAVSPGEFRGVINQFNQNRQQLRQKAKQPIQQPAKPLNVPANPPPNPGAGANKTPFSK